jgi:hypothetical protein
LAVPTGLLSAGVSLPSKAVSSSTGDGTSGIPDRGNAIVTEFTSLDLLRSLRLRNVNDSVSPNPKATTRTFRRITHR